MNVSHHIHDGVCVVLLDGNLALDKVPEALQELRFVLEGREHPKALLLDLKKVNFIDSSGIGLIISLFKVMQERQGGFGLSSLSKKNQEIFSITRLDRIMNIYKTEAEALKQLKAT